MTTALVTSLDCLLHEAPQGHPERVDRLKAVCQKLSSPEFSELKRVEAPACKDQDILSAHSEEHLAQVAQAQPESGLTQLDPDTWMCPDSLKAARKAAGAGIHAVDMVMAGEAGNAFCAVRPPGHHAERNRPMGFCLFGNIAIAALHALSAHGLERVAVVDFDVHHGNGTQDILWSEAGAFFASTHQMPLYPGTGSPEERGGSGNALNVPLASGSGGEEFREAMETSVLPAVDSFDPQLVFISAGFDAHRDDPLAGLNLTEDDFRWATNAICELAKARCGGKVVSMLEGGYDLAALANSVSAHVTTLMEHSS